MNDIMSPALKEDGSKSIRNTIKASGTPTSGKSRNWSSLHDIQCAANVEVHLKYPITIGLTITGRQNTLTLRTRSPTVIGATMAFIPESSSVPYAENFLQNPRVYRALAALGKAIKNELRESIMQEMNLETSRTENNTGNATRIKKSLTRRPGNGRKCEDDTIR